MEIVPISPKLAIIFLFAACLSVHSIQATDIKYCNKKTNYVVKVDDVEISPYPVSTGEPTTFTIKASTGQALTGGKMALDVSYFGVKVHSESHSICEKTSCPISVGKFVLSHTQTLPGITPPVKNIPKTFSRKKRTEVVKQKSSAPKKPASMEKTGKKVAKGKDKPKEVKLRPSDDELRKAICEILKEVDFNTATFTDILKQLAGRFKMDLTPRKASIKLMIQEELTKLADDADDEEDEGDAEKDKTQPSGQGVEA